MAGGAARRSAACHAAKAGTNTSGAGGLYPSEACGLIALIVLRALLNAIFLLPFLAAQSPGYEHVGQALRFCFSDLVVSCPGYSARKTKSSYALRQPRPGGGNPTCHCLRRRCRAPLLQQPQPKIGAVCPSGYQPSGGYCVPGTSFAEGEFTELHELPGKWQVPKEMIGRRLSQEEAKRLLAKFKRRAAQ